MDAAAVRALCESLPASTWDYAFEFGVRCYRVGRKIFALSDDDGARVSVKCDPGLAEVLRQNFDGVTPGYHLNKRHWNTLRLDGSIPPAQIEEMVRHSYELVLAGLSKREQAAIAGRHSGPSSLYRPSAEPHPSLSPRCRPAG